MAPALRGETGRGKPFVMAIRHGTRMLVATLLTVALSVGCASLKGVHAYRQGNQALERGEPAAAVVYLERAATLLPDQSEVHNDLGLALAQTDELDEAVREFERAVELDCDNRAAEANLMLAQQRLRRVAGRPATDEESGQ